MKTLHLLH